MESNATPTMSKKLAAVQPHLLIDSGSKTRASNLAYLPGGKRLVASHFSGSIRIYDVENGKMEGTPMLHGSQILVPVGGLAVTRDGTKIVSSGENGRIKVWNVDSHALVEEWTHPNGYPDIAISPDDRLVAISDVKLTLRHLDGGAEINHSIKFTGEVRAMCFSPDERNLKLACVISVGLYVFDVERGQCVWGPVRPCNCSVGWPVIWSHDGRTIFSAGLVGEIHCIPANTGESIGQPWVGHTAVIRSLSLSPDGSKLASLSRDRTIRFWDATSGNPVGVYLGQDTSMFCFSPFEEVMASARNDKKIYLSRVPWSESARNQVVPFTNASALPLINFTPVRPGKLVSMYVTSGVSPTLLLPSLSILHHRQKDDSLCRREMHQMTRTSIMLRKR